MVIDMKKMISFIVRTDMGFMKKPDINDGIYLTYNMLHKPCVLGILGAIIGLEGYKKNEVLPEYYEKLQYIPVGIKLIGDEKGVFQKTVISYTNTTGFASAESGGVLIVNEQTLIKPSYKIYLLLDLDEENQKKLYCNIKNQESEYLPYLGKNDFSLWWKKDEVEEYEWKNFVSLADFSISTIFKKEEAIINYIAKAVTRRDLSEQKCNFCCFERIPVSIDKKLFQYEMADFAYSNAKLIDEVNIVSENLYFLTNTNEVVYLF